MRIADVTVGQHYRYTDKDALVLSVDEHRYYSADVPLSQRTLHHVTVGGQEFSLMHDIEPIPAGQPGPKPRRILCQVASTKPVRGEDVTMRYLIMLSASDLEPHQ